MKISILCPVALVDLELDSVREYDKRRVRDLFIWCLRQHTIS